MGDDTLFKHESLQDLDSVIAYLEAVRDGFTRRRLTLTDQEREIVLEPKGLVRFDLEAKCKGQGCKLTLKLAWKDRPSDEESGNLTIAAG